MATEGPLQPQVMIACASLETATHFRRSTLLGRSLQSFPEPLRPRLVLLPSNNGDHAIGLSEFYNSVIERIEGNCILVFCHDDVYIHDWNIAHTLDQGLEMFDVLGVVGASNVPWGQPGWWFTLDSENNPVRNDDVIRSGNLNHFDPHLVRPDYYGPAPKACDLLDGFFLATRTNTLREYGLRFDPQFKFHCYDSDFCYSARRKGISLGTWPVSLTHGSAGEFRASWRAAAIKIKEKLASN